MVKMYKIPKISSGGSTSSIVTIQMKKDKPGLVRIVFEDETARILKRDDCPENVRPGTFMVRLDEAKTKMYNLYPANGMFEFTVDSFVSEKDQEPKPKTTVNAQWNYQYFVVLLKITKGDFAGMKVPYLLRYHFGEYIDPTSGEGVVGLTHLRSKYTPQLEEFLEVTKSMEKPIKYVDNVLPILQKRALAAATTFKGVVKGGYINTLYGEDFVPKQEPDDEPELDDGEDLVRETWNNG
jgi:hypothetical protein